MIANRENCAQVGEKRLGVVRWVVLGGALLYTGLLHGTGCVADSGRVGNVQEMVGQGTDAESRPVVSENAFSACVRGGGKVLKSMPPRCINREGKVVTSTVTYEKIGEEGNAGSTTSQGGLQVVDQADDKGDSEDLSGTTGR